MLNIFNLVTSVFVILKFDCILLMVASRTPSNNKSNSRNSTRQQTNNWKGAKGKVWPTSSTWPPLHVHGKILKIIIKKEVPTFKRLLLKVAWPCENVMPNKLSNLKKIYIFAPHIYSLENIRAFYWVGNIASGREKKGVNAGNVIACSQHTHLTHARTQKKGILICYISCIRVYVKHTNFFSFKDPTMSRFASWVTVSFFFSLFVFQVIEAFMLSKHSCGRYLHCCTRRAGPFKYKPQTLSFPLRRKRPRFKSH